MNALFHIGIQRLGPLKCFLKVIGSKEKYQTIP